MELNSRRESFSDFLSLRALSSRMSAVVCAAASCIMVGAMRRAPVVRKAPLFAPFMYKMHHFTKTGSGQHRESTQKRVAFLAGATASTARIGSTSRSSRSLCRQIDRSARNTHRSSLVWIMDGTDQTIICQDRLGTNEKES